MQVKKKKQQMQQPGYRDGDGKRNSPESRASGSRADNILFSFFSYSSDMIQMGGCQ